MPVMSRMSRRIRLTGALAIAGAGIAAIAVAISGVASGAAPVRWLDRPVAIPAPGAVPAIAAGTASCTSASLSVRLARQGIVEFGTYAYTYEATNTSGRPCYVSGFPGVQVAGVTTAHAPNELDVTAGTLPPGASATFAILRTTSQSCVVSRARLGPDARARTPRVKVGGGAGASVAAIHVGACDTTSVTPIGLSPVAPAPDALSSLAVSLNAPATAAAGKGLTFTVTLANPTAKAISLSPCPGYETGVSSGGLEADELNCAVPAIPAHGSVTFAMQFKVPAATPAGVAKIGWFLLNSTRTGAGGYITITR